MLLIKVFQNQLARVDLTPKCQTKTMWRRGLRGVGGVGGGRGEEATQVSPDSMKNQDLRIVKIFLDAEQRSDLLLPSAQ